LCGIGITLFKYRRAHTPTNRQDGEDSASRALGVCFRAEKVGKSLNAGVHAVGGAEGVGVVEAVALREISQCREDIITISIGKVTHGDEVMWGANSLRSIIGI